MTRLEWCPKCDNIPKLKSKCKMCNKNGVVQKGKHGYFPFKSKKN